MDMEMCALVTFELIKGGRRDQKEVKFCVNEHLMDPTLVARCSICNKRISETHLVYEIVGLKFSKPLYVHACKEHANSVRAGFNELLKRCRNKCIIVDADDVETWISNRLSENKISISHN